MVLINCFLVILVFNIFCFLCTSTEHYSRIAIPKTAMSRKLHFVETHYMINSMIFCSGDSSAYWLKVLKGLAGGYANGVILKLHWQCLYKLYCTLTGAIWPSAPTTALHTGWKSWKALLAGMQMVSYQSWTDIVGKTWSWQLQRSQS